MSKHHKMMWIFLFISVIAISWMGCAKKQAADTDAVVTWGDTTVTVADFKAKMFVRFRNEPTAMKKTLEDRLDVLEEYVIRDMKIAEGYRLGFAEREDIAEGYQQSLELASTDLVYNAYVRDRLFSDEQVENYYNHDLYEIRARHILIKVDPEASGKDTVEAWDKINSIYDQAKSGKKFTKLVDRFSEDDSIDRKFHGDLGYFKWGRMVDAFQDVAWDLKVGEVSKPVRTRYGYHIIKTLDRRSRGLEFNTSHILVKCTRRADRAETTAAWERAKMILDEAKKKGADFAQLARRYSEDDRTWVNGEVGYIPRGSMPSDYWDGVFDMKDGEVGGPVRSYKGYHVILVHERRIVEPKLQDEKERERVLSGLARVYRTELQTAAETFLDSLVKSFEMKYDEDVVAMMLKKLNDQMAPENMNRFSLFTAEERELNVINDKIGGLKIGDLAQRFGDNQFQPEYRNEREFIVEMVDQIIMPKYLSDVGRKEGFLNHPKIAADGKRSLENAILPEIEKEMVFNKATPDDESVQEYYEQNKDKYTTKAKASAKEIMVKDKQFAQDLLDRIKKGEDMSKLARKYTQRNSAKKNGGKILSFNPDKYGAVSRKAFELNPGDYAGPIQDGGFYSIIQLLEKTPEIVQTVEQARSKIESDLRFKRQKSIKDEWVEQLKVSYNYQVNMDVLKAVWPIVDQLPEQMEAERKNWYDDRKASGERAAARRKEQGQIKLPVKPGSTQTFERDGKQIKVEIGQPRTVPKGEKTGSTNNQIQLKPKGKSGSNSPKIELKPKKKDN
ncbi:MAG: hypothetical protein HN757_01630 [Calditrichaeota bacterium]|nr:hypothetical protein [Calditrichota bacterium]